MTNHTKNPNGLESELNSRQLGESNPLESTYSIALYQSVEHGNACIFRFYGEAEEHYHSNYVRISEVLTVKFTSLSNDTVIQNAVTMLDATERQVRADCERRVAQIRRQKANLLALTYQPAPEEVEPTTTSVAHASNSKERH